MAPGNTPGAGRSRAADYEVARVLAASTNVDDATPLLLKTLCETLDWDLAEFWIVDRHANTIRLTESWHTTTSGAEPMMGSSPLAFAQGVGLPGHVWNSGQSLWSQHLVTDERFVRTAAAARAQFQSAFAFPTSHTTAPTSSIELDTRVTGAIVCFSRELRRPDDELLEGVSVLGSQIGQFLERKRAERALLAQAEELTSVVASLSDCLWSAEISTEGHWTYRYCSPAVERITGRPPEFYMNDPRRWLRTIHPRDRARRRRVLGRFRMGQSLHEEVEFRIVLPDGTIGWVRESARATPLASGGMRVDGVVSDISERKKSEALAAGQNRLLLEAQKIDALGQLANGVAHDFNNLLTVIIGFTELLVIEQTSPEDPASEMLKQIAAASERGSRLTRQLLAFSGRQLLAPKVVNLNVIVAAMDSSLRRLIGEPVRLAVALEPSLHCTYADIEQLEQVILNLVVNARDAMPQGGDLTIQTRNAELDEVFVRAHPEAKLGPHVALAVRDTGSGMPDHVKTHLFEPFFTTRQRGLGTGLGLATAYGIIRQSGGVVLVESAPGQGTTVEIYLPAELDAEEEPVPAASLVESARGTETVLVVDDQEAVRKMVRRVLERQGYAVIEAESGIQALEIVGEDTRRVDLLLTDLAMPEMSGVALAVHVRMLRSGLRVLYMSGYTSDPAVDAYLRASLARFIQRPFTTRALLEIVRETLEE